MSRSALERGRRSPTEMVTTTTTMARRRKKREREGRKSRATKYRTVQSSSAPSRVCMCERARRIWMAARQGDCPVSSCLERGGMLLTLAHAPLYGRGMQARNASSPVVLCKAKGSECVQSRAACASIHVRYATPLLSLLLHWSTVQATPGLELGASKAGGVTACRIRKEQAQSTRGRHKYRAQGQSSVIASTHVADVLSSHPSHLCCALVSTLHQTL